MIDTLLSDFSRVLLFPKEEHYTGQLNELYRKLLQQKEFHFFDHYRLNEELLGLYSGLKSSYSVNIFTTDIIQNDLAVRKIIEPIFHKIYVASEMGLSKKDPSAYIYIAKDLGREPKDILFIDDSLSNIEAAEEAGFHTVQFIANVQAIGKIEELLGFSPI